MFQNSKNSRQKETTGKLNKNRKIYGNRVVNEIQIFFRHYSFANQPKFLKLLRITNLSSIQVSYNFHRFPTILGEL